MIVVDLRARARRARRSRCAPGAMPQDVKLSPDGRTFYVADMASSGVWLIDARTLAHDPLPADRAGARTASTRAATRAGCTCPTAARARSACSRSARGGRSRKWRIPGGGSPDMGGVSADGRVLWLTGRYDGEVYAISTRTGRLLHRIQVGSGPHGMCVWPQPGPLLDRAHGHPALRLAARPAGAYF